MINRSFFFLLFLYISISVFAQVDDSKLLSYAVDPLSQDLRFFWKDNQGNSYQNFANLKDACLQENKTLVFAMNGGMYIADGSPQGLYIENGKQLTKVDTQATGYGNFYLQPNGIFYSTYANEVCISTTSEFKLDSSIKYATQSGPMLLINGNVHPKFTKGSPNLNIRNGVGVLPDGKLLFVMSKERINFYDFAMFFKRKGCMNALYLDGFVSRTYLPAQNWEQLDGNFGVIIGVVE